MCTLRKSCLVLLPFAVLALAFASPVVAHDDDEVSRAGKCTKSSSARLDLRQEDKSGKDGEGKDGEGERDNTISVTFSVRSNRSGESWSVIVLHERRIALRAKRRTQPPKGTFVLRHSLPDWYGSEEVAARARSPRGEICRASARL